jgi:hypothetical protein
MLQPRHRTPPMHMTIVAAVAMVMAFAVAVAMAVTANAALRIGHTASMHEHAPCGTSTTTSPPQLHSKRNYQSHPKTKRPFLYWQYQEVLLAAAQ